MKVDLQKSHPMRTTLSLWHHNISECSAECEILYNARLNGCIPPNAPHNNFNIHIVNVLVINKIKI